MQIKPLKIKNLTLNSNLFMAPLAGYTNFAVRKTCLNFGAGLCCTEMVSAKGLKYDNDNTKDLLYTCDDEKVKAVQIFGSEPEIMCYACESEYLNKFDIIDINMGCPVPKIYKNGEGSALLNDLPLASKIIKECVKSGKIITVKFRIGLNENNLITEDFAKTCEDSGASLITIHGRTRDKIYAGEVNFNEIEKAKKAVKIPVIANGGVFDIDSCDELLNKTGADGVMLARGGLFTPWLFKEITENKVVVPDINQILFSQINGMLSFYDERFTTIFMRKMATIYIKGRRGASELKQKLFQCNSVDSLKRLIENEL